MKFNLLEFLLGKKGNPEEEECLLWGPPQAAGGGSTIYVIGEDNNKTAALFEATKAAAKQMELPDEIAMETGADKVKSYGAAYLPAVVIDGNVVTEDKEYTVDELVRVIEKA